TDGGSISTAAGTSTGVSLSPIMKPIMGKELSSREFVSIDEQLFKYMQFIDGLRDRTCAVRTASLGTTVQITTNDVKTPRTTVPWSRRFLINALGKLAFT